MNRSARATHELVPSGAPPSLTGAACIAAFPECAPFVDALDPLLAACLRVGTSRLHLEASPEGLLARPRSGATLSTRRLALRDGASPAAAFDAWLDAVAASAERRAAFLWRLPDATLHVSLELARTADGTSAVLELAAHAPVAPTLDELVPDAVAARALRGTLHDGPGLVLVVGDDRVALARLADAVAQAATAPDRKVVRASAVRRHALAGVVRIDTDTDLGVDMGVDTGIDTGAGPGPGVVPARRRTDGRLLATLLGQDADVHVIDDGVPPPVAAALALRTQGRALLVRTLPATSIGAALALLVAEGTDARWLATHLRAVVGVDRLHRLCPRCRRGVAAQGPDALLGSLAPMARRACESPGCPACHDTGVERAEPVVDVLIARDDVAAALRCADLAAAASALRRRARSGAHVRALVEAGLVGVDEGLRFD